MAGFENEVLYATGERLQPSSAQAISIMQQAPNTTNVSRINYVGNPNGAVSANPSSLCHDPVSGDIWRKTAGTGPFSWATIGTGVITVSGTVNRITSTGGLAPIIDIDAAYVGQTSITTLGTIGTGVWNGTTIAVTSGGTGLSATTINQILYSSASNVIAGITSVNRAVLTANSTGVPIWRAITDGQLIIGSSSSQPIAANITSSDSSITVTNGANSISLTVATVPLDYTEIFLLGGM